MQMMPGELPGTYYDMTEGKMDTLTALQVFTFSEEWQCRRSALAGSKLLGLSCYVLLSHNLAPES